jgi:hypothetical protein
MADTHPTPQLEHVSGMEYVPSQSVALAQVQPPTLTGNDASGILTAVLQY